MRNRETSLDHYLSSIARTPLLTADEEHALAVRARQGDETARRKLVEANLRFVVKIARSYQNKGLPLSDLIQEGNLGLMEAVRKFDPAKGFRMTTYASWWIRLYVQRALEQKAGVVNMPINKIETLKRISNYVLQYEKTHGDKPSHQQIAEQLELPREKVDELLNHRPVSVSMDTAESEDSAPLERVMRDDSHQQLEHSLFLFQSKKRLRKTMQVLSARERDVLESRFGLNGDEDEGKSLRQIGQLFNLSAEGVRRIEDQAMQKLRRPSVMAQMEGLLT